MPAFVYAPFAPLASDSDTVGAVLSTFTPAITADGDEFPQESVATTRTS